MPDMKDIVTDDMVKNALKSDAVTGGGVDGKQSYGRQTVPAEAETGRR